MKQKITEGQIRRIIREAIKWSPALYISEQAETLEQAVISFQQFLEGEEIKQFTFLRRGSDFVGSLEEVETCAKNLLTALEDLKNVRP